MIVRVRPPGVDPVTADPIDGEPARKTLDGAFVAPRISNDINDRGRTGVIVGLTLFAPYGAELLHGDQLEVTGEGTNDGLYDIDGDAGQWKNPFTEWEAGCEVALIRAAG